MADLALRWDLDEGAADLAVEANDLATDEGLETAVLLSLFTDRRADATDTLPSGETDRRGWWGDAVPVVEGDRHGSRLWLLERATQSPSILPRVEEYGREALDWLLEDKVAARVDVTASLPRTGALLLEVAIYRPHQADPVRFRYHAVWAAQEA